MHHENMKELDTTDFVKKKKKKKEEKKKEKLTNSAQFLWDTQKYCDNILH